MKLLFDTIITIIYNTLVLLWAIFGNPLSLTIIGIIAIVIIAKMICYYNTTYYNLTKNSFWCTHTDTGKYGEYLTYKNLKNYEKSGGRFLFNIYIPKENGETTEIDVLLLTNRGIFVFESKNYSGWIFGSENQYQWTQTLPKGRGRSHKERFYNPIKQNETHIKNLTNIIGNTFPIWSIIVFSERCTLKNVPLSNNNVYIIKRNKSLSVLEKIHNNNADTMLTNAEIKDIYDKLYPYSQTTSELKEQHIENINKNFKSKNAEKEDATEKTEAQNEIKQEKNETEILKCPKCGSDLVLKTASRGENKGKTFYGCSAYPHCRYIQNVEKTEQEIFSENS